MVHYELVVVSTYLQTIEYSLIIGFYSFIHHLTTQSLARYCFLVAPSSLHGKFTPLDSSTSKSGKKKR